jgi:putative ABC transport system permease protein
MISLLDDIRSSARALIRRPTFTALVVCVLGAGLACSIFMMAMLNGFVVRPLPFADPERLLHAGIYDERYPDYLAQVTTGDLLEIRRQLGGAAEVGAFARIAVDLTDVERPDKVDGASVTANLFPILRIAPFMGRGFSMEDERDGAPPVAIVSYGLWRNRYSDDKDIVGRRIRVDGQSTLVVGVMPMDFSFPTKETIWLPMHSSVGRLQDAPSNSIVLRISGNSTESKINAELANWFQRASEAEPDRFKAKHVGTESLANLNVSATCGGPFI